MTEVFEDLKKNEILHQQHVLALRQYIDRKYPYDTARNTSKIFADAVHKIIDKNIIPFSQEVRPHIKSKLFKEIAEKETFTINAFEIYQACAQLDIHDTGYLGCLTQWINQNQRNQLLEDKVLELTLGLRGAVEVIPVSEHIAIERDIAEPLVLLETFERFVTIKKVVETPKRYKVHRIQTWKGNWKRWKESIQIRISQGLKRRLIIGFLTTMVFSVLIVGSKAILDQKFNEDQYLPIDYLLDFPVAIDEVLLEASHIKTKENQQDYELQYIDVNLETLKFWLIERDSLLAEEPYFTAIITAAKDYNVHPLLMFAITGQEQAFVPKSNVHATEMANNPFNVFGSWEDYNTNIQDASNIAAKTIVNLRKDCPKEMDIIQWINRKYAEDPHWHSGVSTILLELNEEIK